MRKLMMKIVIAVLAVMISTSTSLLAQTDEPKGITITFPQNANGLMGFLASQGHDPRAYVLLLKDGPQGELLSCEEDSFEIRSIRPGQVFWLPADVKLDAGRLNHCLAVENKLFGAGQEVARKTNVVASTSPVPPVASTSPVASATTPSPEPNESADQTVILVNNQEVKVPIDVAEGIVVLRTRLANAEQDLASANAEIERLRKEPAGVGSAPEAVVDDQNERERAVWVMWGIAVFFTVPIVLIGAVTEWRRRDPRTSWRAEPEYWLFDLWGNMWGRLRKPSLEAGRPNPFLSPIPHDQLAELAERCGQSVSPTTETTVTV